MTEPPATRRRLAWGPFAIGLLATLGVAYAGWRITDASRGHWWFLLTGVVFAIGTLMVAASAGLALVERGAKTR